MHIFDVYENTKILGTIKAYDKECLKNYTHLYTDLDGKNNITKSSHAYIANLDYIDGKIEEYIKILRQNITSKIHQNPEWVLAVAGSHEDIASDIHGKHKFEAVDFTTHFYPAVSRDFSNNIKEFNKTNKLLSLIDHPTLGPHRLIWYLANKVKIIPSTGKKHTIRQLLEKSGYGRYMHKSKLNCYLDHDDSITMITVENKIKNDDGHYLTGDTICAANNEVCLSVHDNYTNTDVDCADRRDSECILKNGSLDSECTPDSIKRYTLKDGGEQTGYQYCLRQHKNLCIIVQHIQDDGSVIPITL